MSPRIRELFNRPTPDTGYFMELVEPSSESAWQAIWADVFQTYRPMLIAKARDHGLQRADAEWIADQVLEKMMLQPDLFVRRRNGVGFRAYLFVCVKNAVADLRDQRQRLAAMLPEGGDGAHSRLMCLADSSLRKSLSKVLSKAVRAHTNRVRIAIARVKASCRKPHTFEAFWLLCVERFPSAEVARMLNISEAAVTQAKYTVKNRILAELGVGYLV